MILDKFNRSCFYSAPMIGLRFLLILMWLSNLHFSDSFASVYILCAMAGACCTICNTHNHATISICQYSVILLSSLCFSLFVLLANLPLFEPLYGLLNLVNFLFTLAGGVCIGCESLIYMLQAASNDKEVQNCTSSRKPAVVYFLSFGLIVLIDLAYLFFYQYPGSISIDSLNQLEQIYWNAYTNHHPYWHTILIRACLFVGNLLFHSPNAGVAVYSIFQICLIAGAFSYAVVTLYQVHCRKWPPILLLCLYTFHPYHISLSITMWKDVVFAAAVLYFLVSLYRIFYHVGKREILNYLFCGLSTVGCCLWRTNGWIAFLGSALLFLILLRKSHRKFLIILICSIAFSWVLKSPVLSSLGVAQPDFVESLSIPIQQIAYVITEEYPLSEEESALIDQVVDIEQVPELYTPTLSDPIKNLIRSKNQPYLQAHKAEYLKLWIQLGLRYPAAYLKGWISQTRGYWNGGYPVSALFDDVVPNPFGIYRSSGNPIFSSLFSKYTWFFDASHFLEPLRSIGFHFWVLFALSTVFLLNKRKEFYLTIPLLLIIFTLWIATPLDCEFRYAYSLFTSLPFLLGILFGKPQQICQSQL